MMKRRLHIVVLSLVSLLLLSAEDSGCSSSIVGDPTFDLWCGDDLCAWKVEAGEVRRVPTWHRSDYGVELVGNAVVLSQETSSASDCLEIRLQADYDDGVTLDLEVDIFADHQADHVEPVTSDRYRQVTVHLALSAFGEKVRFAVRKSGEGRAVLAEVKIANVVGECEGSAAVHSLFAPAGQPCGKPEHCSSGYCSKVRQWRADVDEVLDVNVARGELQVCGTCARDADCSGGQICGLNRGPSELRHYLHRACVDRDAAEIGQRCAVDAECSSAVCCNDVCSACCPNVADQSCAAGGTCKLLDPATLGEDFARQLTPALCSAPGKSGDPCLDDGDCESGSCTGLHRVGTCTLDGRDCSSSLNLGCRLWAPKCLEFETGGRCD